MNSFSMKSAFGVVLLMGWILPETGAILLPLELVKVVTLLPSTPNIASSGIAYFALLLTVKLFLVCFWLGFPRIPNRPNIRSLADELPFSSYFHGSPLSTNGLGKFLDTMSRLDEDTCLRRLFCHLESLPEEQLTFFQKITLKLLWMSASPSLNYSSIRSPRRDFINAAYFAKTTKCGRCCELLYSKCTAETETLLRII